MSSPETKGKIMAVVLFALPIGLVKVASFYLGQPGPASAEAAPTPTAAGAAPAAPVSAPVWSAKQIAASKHITKLRNLPITGTPFLYETKEEQQPSKGS